MNGPDPAPAEAKYTELFVAGEEALAAGPPPPPPPPEVAHRVEGHKPPPKPPAAK